MAGKKWQNLEKKYFRQSQQMAEVQGIIKDESHGKQSLDKCKPMTNQETWEWEKKYKA